MPTFQSVGRFRVEYDRLSREEKTAFRAALPLFIAGVVAGHFHPRLRVKSFKKIPGKPSPHVIWLRIGTHGIFER
ncbi:MULTISPECIES: hypothetical protein [unclassified Frankia]|uniref:hypothetical protein n=1 Tax=unclassified Frankia TaxID=2632575 RepID=UPI0020255560